MAHDIFICHAHADLNTALAACAKLEDAGVRCWIAPRNVDAGPYARQLVHAITEASAVLLIFSNKTNQSEHILRELEIASKHQKVIIPFRIEDVPPNEDLEYFTLRVHWLDALSPPMETRLAELVAFVKRLLAARPALTAPAVPSTAPAPNLIEAEPRGIQARVAAAAAARPLLDWLKTSTGVVGSALAAAAIVLVIAFATRPPSRVPFPYRTFAPISGGSANAFLPFDRGVQNCPMDGAVVSDFFSDASQWGKFPSDVQIARGFLNILPQRGHFEPVFHTGRFHADGIICTRFDAFGPNVPPSSGDTSAGVIFWSYTPPPNGDPDYYAFQVNYRGDFMAWHRNHGGWTMISRPTRSNAIRTQAAASNVLAVRTNGHTAFLYVNGTQVGTVNGNPPTDGWWAGVLAGIGKDEQRFPTWGFDAYGVALTGAPTAGQR
jgi:hypothetical protein